MYILASICILIFMVAVAVICQQQRAIRLRARTKRPANDNLEQSFVYRVGKRRPRKW